MINKEWKTMTTVKAAAGGTVAFRGFRGQYRLSWTDASGDEKSACVDLGGGRHV
jgi:hypothetical protein